MTVFATIDAACSDLTLYTPPVFDTLIGADPAVLGWLCPDAARLTKDGSSRVSSVTSRAAAATTFAQATAANQPLWEDAQINGLPTLYYDAIRKDRLAWSGAFPTAGDFSVAAVVKAAASAGAGNNRVIAKTLGTVVFELRQSNDDRFVAVVGDTTNYSRALSAVNLVNGQPHLVIASYDFAAKAVTLIVDSLTPIVGAAAGTGPAAALSSSPLNVGLDVTANNYGLNGRIGDLLVENVALAKAANATQLAAIKTLYLERYGITV